MEGRGGRIAARTTAARSLLAPRAAVALSVRTLATVAALGLLTPAADPPGAALIALASGPAAAADPVPSPDAPTAESPALPGAGYPWFPPLAAPLLLTGTLGEPRTGHLHGGVDFSTGGEVGRPVYAVAGGTVVRVRAKAAGYGRAVYLDTDVGLQAVYGHLDRFAPALEAYVRREQEAQGEFEIELYPEPGQFRFARGDVLAYSGDTGAGPPHLHFELRQGDEQLNPLLLGIQAHDNVAPSLGPIRLRALAARGWVDGGIAGERLLPVTEPIAVWGPVGVEVGVFDRTGQNTSRLAPLHVRLWLDDRLVFARTFARVDLARGNDVRRVYGRPCQGSGRWILRLYRWPAGAPPDAAEGDPGLGDGRIDAALLSPGPHVVRVEAQDAAGRRDSVSWRIEAVAPIVPAEWRCEPDVHGGWIAGLRLAEQPDAGRLPLRLAWRPAGAPDRDQAARAGGETRWLALGEGWFAAHVPASGPLELEILDAAGRRVGAPLTAGSPGGLADATVQMQAAEGGILLELRCSAALPGLPSIALEDEQGRLIDLIPRGLTSGGAWAHWLESAGPMPVRGPLRTARLRAGAERRVLTLPASGLLALEGPDTTGASPATRVGPLTVRPLGAAFPGPLCLVPDLWAPGDARWEDLAARAERGGSGDENGGLRLLSPVVGLGPEWWPLGAPLEIVFDAESLIDRPGVQRERCGVYRLTESNSWRWVSQVDSAGPLGGTVNALGRWAVLEDAAPPRLLWGDPRPDAQLAHSPGRLRVGLTDLGSGFDPRDADIFMDGRMLLAEWDIDAGTLSAAVPPGLAPGTHRWEARVADRAGNVASRDFEFRIGGARPPAKKR